MIHDSLAGWKRYQPILPPWAEKGFAFLLEKANAELTEGRHEIDGDRAYAIVAKYTTRDFDRAPPEAHRKYMDVQFLIAGRETIYWTPLAAVAPENAPYDAERDLVFFGHNAHSRPFELAAGNFAIFFPTDAHAPNCHVGAPGQVHKAVVKLRVE